MHNHRGRPTDTSHFVHILMRGHHASGGTAPVAAMGPSRGNMPDNTSHYRKGGKTHRRHHADGDMTGVSPITGERSPDVLAKRKGGRACHAEGDMVATPQKRGGPSRRKRSRQHHGWGDFVHGVENVGKKIGNGFRNAGNAVGNAAQYAGNELGNAAHNVQRGANYVFNQRHAEGDMVATPQKRGGKTRRKHHAIGDRIRGLLGNLGNGAGSADGGSGAGPLIKRPALLGLAMAARRRGMLGGRNQQQSPGMVRQSLLGRQSAGAPEEGLRRGGPSRRHRHADGDNVEMMARGGRKKKAIREHHSFGKTVGDVASTLANFLPLFLNEGGSADSADKLATGGVGKIRRGMLSKNGKIIKNY